MRKPRKSSPQSRQLPLLPLGRLRAKLPLPCSQVPRRRREGTSEEIEGMPLADAASLTRSEAGGSRVGRQVSRQKISETERALYISNEYS